MVMVGSAWPLPSQSRRVRGLLYLAEGLMLGAGLTFILLTVAGATFATIESELFNLDILVIEVLAVLFVLFVLLRGVALGVVARRSPRYRSPKGEDWQETRRWPWVVAVALPVAGVLLGAMFLWGEWVFYGALLAGLLLHGYVRHRIKNTRS